MVTYEEKFFRSRDGLQLHYRDYAGAPDATPVLCLHGLTRNGGDFAPVAAQLAGRRRVIAPDQRGRGRSQYDPQWLNYHPLTYVDDMWLLLQYLSIDRVVAIGTSMGGLMAMLMAAARPSLFAGIVLNDIGPELDPVGAARIREYAGRLPPVASWHDAVEQMKLMFGEALPDYSEDRWLEFTHRTFLVGPDGSPQLAADPRIGDALRAIHPPPGAAQAMWFAFASARHIPILALRGAHSDLLSQATFERMQREHPKLTAVTVPNRGHPPQLDEPECVEAIEKFLRDEVTT